MEITINPSCNTSTLTPFIPDGGNPWDTKKVKHLYRRLGFSANMDEVDAALSETPSNFVDAFVDAAFNLPPTAAPPWGYFAFSDFTDYQTENNENIVAWRIQSGNDFLAENLRGRITFFWMNHFVTELETYFYSPYMFQYYNTIQTHALGNFKTLTLEMGKSNAMLLYLNGFENTDFNPNENYARELFELFTLGEGNNYTQNDILEASRALTGYNHWSEFGGDIYFDSSTWDDGEKTIFGVPDFYDHDTLIDVLFNERPTEIATFICTKLYKYFVSPTIDQTIEDDIIAPLAQSFIAANFELAPVLKELFKSEHFFDERATGVIVKSPFDVFMGFIKETNFFYDDTLMDAFLYYGGLMGQEIYDPPDVSGWQRDETWINSSTLTGRWQLMELYVNYLFGNGHELSLTDLAKALTNNSNDPAYITQVLVDHLVPKELHTSSDYEIATEVLKWDVPQNYYDTGQWNLDWSSAPFQVSLLLKHIARMPEFQLK